jgi:hypothetical protein
MDLFNYSSSPFIPGFDIGNMMAFASPETLVANNANRKKLIEQRSKNRKKPIEQSSKVNNDSSGNTNKEKVDLSDYKALEFLYSDNKNKKEGGGEGVLENIINEVLDKKEKDGEDIDYGKMTEYAKGVIGEVDKVAQRARERDFFREGIRSFANAPLIGAQANLEAAKNIADLTALNMGAMAAQNRVLETNPTKQRFAGKYFR